MMHPNLSIVGQVLSLCAAHNLIEAYEEGRTADEAFDAGEWSGSAPEPLEVLLARRLCLTLGPDLVPDGECTCSAGEGRHAPWCDLVLEDPAYIAHCIALLDEEIAGRGPRGSKHIVSAFLAGWRSGA